MPSQYELETLVTRLMAETKDLRRGLHEAERLIQNTAKVADKQSRNISQSLGGIGQTAVGVGASLLGLGSIMQSTFRAVQLAAGAETMRTTFRVLVGEAELAKQTLMELEEFALKTPFEMPELMGAAKQMIAFGEEAQNLVPTMRSLGDVSAGLGIPLRDLTYLYGTLKSQGRAFTIDIRQFAMRGIPIYLELAKVMGLVSAEAKKVPPDVREAMDKAITGGEVNFDLVEQAFKNMTSAGGQFFGLMEERSKTLEGLFNEMKESIDISLREIGNSLIEGLQLHEVLRQIASLTHEFNTFIKGLSAGTKRATLVVMGLIGVFIALQAIIYAAGVAITVFTGGLNIWVGLITAAIAGTAVWAYHMGGLQKAWNRVREAATDFWNFIKPMLPAVAALMLLLSAPLAPLYAGIALLIYYWDEVTEAVKNVWRESQPVLRAAWSFIKEVAFTIRSALINVIEQAEVAIKTFGTSALAVFALITNVSNVSWKELRDGLRDFFIFSEYIWTRFPMYVELAMWKSRGYLLYLEGVINHFFREQIPAALEHFLAFWKAAFSSALTIGQSFMSSLLNIISKGITNLPDIISGKFDMTKLLKDEMSNFAKVVKDETLTLPQLKLPERATSEAEKNVQKEVMRMQELLQEGLSGFYLGKIEMWQWEDAKTAFNDVWNNLVTPFLFPSQQEAVKAGEMLGSGLGTGFDKEYKKVDAVLRSSAEAISRMTEYRDRLPNIDRGTRIDINKTATLTQAPPPRPIEREQVSWLEKIYNELQQQNSSPPTIEVVAADIP